MASTTMLAVNDKRSDPTIVIIKFILIKTKVKNLIFSTNCPAGKRVFLHNQYKKEYLYIFILQTANGLSCRNNQAFFIWHSSEYVYTAFSHNWQTNWQNDECLVIILMQNNKSNCQWQQQIIQYITCNCFCCLIFFI